MFPKWHIMDEAQCRYVIRERFILRYSQSFCLFHVIISHCPLSEEVYI